MSQRVNVPVTTLGISFDNGITNEDGSKVNHIHEIPFFQRYTIDEIRYYDYLKEGYISIVIPDVPQFNTQYQAAFQPNQYQVFPNNYNYNNNQMNESNIIYHQVSPWSMSYSQFSDAVSMPEMHQAQPYGTLPDPNFNYSSLQAQLQQEDSQDQQQIPFDQGMNQPPSLFHQFNNQFHS